MIVFEYSHSRQWRRLVTADIANLLTELDKLGLGIGAAGIEARAGPALKEMGCNSKEVRFLRHDIDTRVCQS